MSTAKKKTNREKGIVSIMVTLVIMLVISLIVISYSRISRREQRQALDRQLSSQAFYAAETGVNIAKKAIENGTVNPATNDTDCSPAPISDADITLDPTATAEIKVTCLLLNLPTSLRYQIDDESQVIPVNSDDGSAVQFIDLTWTRTSGASQQGGCNTSNGFPAGTTLGANCNLPLLRVDLVDTNGTMTRNGLIDNTFTAFFYPSTTGDSAIGLTEARGLTAQGVIHPSTCDVNGRCTQRIEGLSSPKYTMRIRSLYGASNLEVVAGNVFVPALRLSGAQVVVDSTGKANDVLRRIQVRLPVGNSLNVPDFAAQGGAGFCKRFNVIAGAGGSVTIDDPSPPPAGVTNPCAIN